MPNPGGGSLPRFFDPLSSNPWYGSGTAPTYPTFSGQRGFMAPKPETPAAPKTGWKTFVDITYGVGDKRAGQQRLVAADPAFNKPQSGSTSGGTGRILGGTPRRDPIRYFNVGSFDGGPPTPADDGGGVAGWGLPTHTEYDNNLIGQLQSMVYPVGALGRGTSTPRQGQHPMDALSGFSNAHLQYMGLI